MNASKLPWTITGIVVAILIFFGGRILGQEDVRTQMRKHIEEPGHAVVVERVDRQYTEILRRLDAIDRRLETVGQQRDN